MSTRTLNSTGPMTTGLKMLTSVEPYTTYQGQSKKFRKGEVETC